MPVKANREYRTMALMTPTNENKKIDTDYYIEGYATTYSKPYLLAEIGGVKYWERIDPGALVGADLSDVIMQFDHNGKVFARTSNGTLILDPCDPHGLFTAADLGKSVEARNAHEEVKSGLITRMSWAFVVEKDSYDKATNTRTILKIKKVYDVSLVSIPANNDTFVQARSWVDGVIDAERQELAARKRKMLNLLTTI